MRTRKGYCCLFYGMWRETREVLRFVFLALTASLGLLGCAPASKQETTPTPIILDTTQQERVSTSPLSLSDGVRLGILNSNNILASTILAKQSQNEVVIARSAFFPDLFFNVQPPSAESGLIASAGLGARYTLFDFGARAAELEAARSGVSKSAFELILETEETALAVADVYIDVAIDNDQIKASDAFLASIKGLQDAVRARVDIGIASSIDLNEIEAGLLTANAATVRATAEAETSNAALASLVGIKPRSVSNTTAVMQTLSAQNIRLPEELTEFASFAALTEDVEIAEQQLKATRAGLLPRIGVRIGPNLDIGRNGAVTGTGTVIGPEISNTFTLGGGRAAQIENAELQVQIAMRASSEEERQLRLRFSQAEIELAASRSRVDKFRQILNLARDRRDVMESEYELGNRDLRDLIDAEERIFDAQIDLNEAFRDRLKAQLAMLRAGNLLSVKLFEAVAEE